MIDMNNLISELITLKLKISQNVTCFAINPMTQGLVMLWSHTPCCIQIYTINLDRAVRVASLILI